MSRVFSKSAKMLVLTLMSILIISATAAVYYSLDATSTITTAANDIYFTLGPDNSAGVSIFNDNKSATLTGLKAYPNISMTYDDPIRVRNNHTSTTYKVRLRPVTLSGNAANFAYINFTLQTTTKISLNYTSDGTSWNTPSTTDFVDVNADTEYAIIVQTMANATATSGLTATIEIAIDIEQ